MDEARKLVNWSTGICCLLVATLIWAVASVLAQYIYQDLNFHSPFMMTFIANSLFVIYLPLWQLWIFLGVVKKENNPRRGSLSILTMSSNPMVSANQLINSSAIILSQDSVRDHNSENSEHVVGEVDQDDAAGSLPKIPQLPKYTHMHALRAALIISPMYFLANCLYNYSLYMTSVSSSTIISNLAASFTLFFSWYAGLESITWSKVIGLILCFFGAIAVGLNDAEAQGSQQERSMGGDAVALLSAAGYGAYTTLIRLQLPDEDSISMQLVLGYIGAIVFTTMMPIILILFFSGAASSSLTGLQNMTWTALGFIILGGLCDNVFSDYLWARAVVLTSPTVATVGMSITIPFAMLSDFLLHKAESVPIWSMCGAALVVLGFILVNFEPTTLEAYCMPLYVRAERIASRLGLSTGFTNGRYSKFDAGDSLHGSVNRSDYVKNIHREYATSVNRVPSDDGDTDSETGLTGR